MPSSFEEKKFKNVDTSASSSFFVFVGRHHRRRATTTTTTTMVEKQDAKDMERISWANSLRKVVTRSDAIDVNDGSIKSAVFKPTKIVFETSRRMGQEQRRSCTKAFKRSGSGSGRK